MKVKAAELDGLALTLPEDEHGQFWYIRTNLKTGNETREKFTPIQSPIFGDARFAWRKAALKQAMDDCIRSWNRQMPDTYFYRLDLPVSSGTTSGE